MAAVSFRPHARLDLMEVYRRIAEFNPLAAAKIVRHLGNKAQLLAKSPKMGQSVENLAPNLRRFPVGDYLIFYKPATDGIEVVRILHGARHIEALFSDQSGQGESK